MNTRQNGRVERDVLLFVLQGGREIEGLTLVTDDVLGHISLEEGVVHIHLH